MRRGQAARALRAVALTHAALVLAQAAFAGRYLGGDAASLRLHERNAELIVTLALATWRLARADLGASWAQTVMTTLPRAWPCSR